jgi:hypothetical protein
LKKTGGLICVEKQNSKKYNEIQNGFSQLNKISSAIEDIEEANLEDSWKRNMLRQSFEAVFSFPSSLAQFFALPANTKYEMHKLPFTT